MGEIAYSPLDYRLEIPSVRMLRALRFFDWVDARTLWDVIGVPDYSQVARCPERNGASVALARLLRHGYVERIGRVPHALYRVTASGKRYAREAVLSDLAVEYAPARPGTEHLLCEWTEDECR